MFRGYRGSTGLQSLKTSLPASTKLTRRVVVRVTDADDNSSREERVEMAIRDWVAEQVMKVAFYTASPFTASGEPIRWTVSQYFQRFKWKPTPTVRREIVEEYRPAPESQKG